jgi:hypothetical protein
MATALTSSFAPVVAPFATAALSTLYPHVCALSKRLYSSTGRIASFSLPPELINTGNLSTLGCSPRFFRKWMEFQFELSGRGFTWYNRGVEWDFARFDIGIDDEHDDVFESDLDDDTFGDEFENKLQEYERRVSKCDEGSGGNGSSNDFKRSTSVYETMHWSNFYPARKGEWVEKYDFSKRSRIVRRFMALHVFADVRGSSLYDGTSVIYDRDSWLQRSIMS